MSAVLSLRGRLVLIVTSWAAVLVSGLCAEGKPGQAAAPMASPRPMQQGRFGLKDTDFFRPADAAVAAGVAALKKEGFRGLALDAPKSVSVVSRDRCPAVLADIDLARTLLTSPLEKHGLLIATDLHRHRTLVAPVVQARNPLADRPPLGMPSATQLSARSYDLDLRARLGLPWEPAELRVQVVNGDRISNQVGISLRGGTKARTPVIVPPPASSEAKSPLGSFEKTASSPAPPSEPGLRIVVGGAAGPEDAMPVSGSFLVPRSAIQVISAEQRKSQRAPIPFGIVTIALVLAGGPSSVAEKLEVDVPVFPTATESARQDRFAGYFALDLATHMRAARGTQPLYLYAFCDELRAGPLPLTPTK